MAILVPFAIKAEEPTTPNIDTQRKGSGNIIIYVPQDNYYYCFRNRQLAN